MTGSGSRVGRVLAAAARALEQADVSDAARDAEVLLGSVLGVNRAWILAHPDGVLEGEGAVRFEAVVARRARHEPVAYILGEREFWSMAFEVTPDVLIPRPETELLVELAVARLRGLGAVRAADVGTGSGAIAAALAAELPSAWVMATDVSPAALAVARRNLARHGLADRVALAQGDLLEPLAGLEPFDAIVSNPPYVAESAHAELMRGVREWEPPGALLAGSDGLACIRRLVAGAPPLLRAGGWLLLEHGDEQGAATRELLAAGGFTEVATARDLAGRERVGFGRTPR